MMHGKSIIKLFMFVSNISLLLWLCVYFVFISFYCLFKAILCVVWLNGFGFHFCADSCSWSGLFSVLYIGLCQVGLSKSFYVWFYPASFVGEYLARIAVILVKTARFIQSPWPIHVLRGGGGGRESSRLIQFGVLGGISIHSWPGRIKEMGQKESSLKSFNSNVKKEIVSGIGEYICLQIMP
jgi:hypothetical protein